jgi:hypothetical protein
LKVECGFVKVSEHVEYSRPVQLVGNSFREHGGSWFPFEFDDCTENVGHAVSTSPDLATIAVDV